VSPLRLLKHRQAAFVHFVRVDQVVKQLLLKHSFHRFAHRARQRVEQALVRLLLLSAEGAHLHQLANQPFVHFCNVDLLNFRVVLVENVE
jgi:hypothetical protein